MKYLKYFQFQKNYDNNDKFLIIKSSEENTNF